MLHDVVALQNVLDRSEAVRRFLNGSKLKKIVRKKSQNKEKSLCIQSPAGCIQKWRGKII
jgi:hypothetical protein